MAPACQSGSAGKCMHLTFVRASNLAIPTKGNLEKGGLTDLPKSEYVNMT